MHAKAYPNLVFSRTLLMLGIFFIAFASLFLMMYLFVYFKGGKATEIQIQKNEVNDYLKYPGEIAWPNWEIENITYEDDHFTHPNITVQFQNGIALKLSKAKVNLSHMKARTLDIDGEEFTYYSDRRQKYFLWTKGFVYYLIIAPETMDDETYYGYIQEVMEK